MNGAAAAAAKAEAVQKAVEQPIAPEAGKDGGAPAPLNEGQPAEEGPKNAAREGEHGQCGRD